MEIIDIDNKLYQTDPRFIFQDYIMIFDNPTYNYKKNVLLSSVNTQTIVKTILSNLYSK